MDLVWRMAFIQRDFLFVPEQAIHTQKESTLSLASVLDGVVG
jgi:hypothetical protein